MSTFHLYKECPVRATALWFLSGAVIGLLATGCVSGRPINWSKVSQITEGASTKAEVEGLLGKPDSVVESMGYKSFSYNYVRIGIQGNTIKNDGVIVMFDNKGIVRFVATARDVQRTGAVSATYPGSGADGAAYQNMMQRQQMQQNLKQNQQMNQMNQSMKYRPPPPPPSFKAPTYQPRR